MLYSMKNWQNHQKVRDLAWLEAVKLGCHVVLFSRAVTKGATAAAAAAAAAAAVAITACTP